MKYKYIDTFTKSCSSKDGKGVCKKTRESVKCIDDKCEKVQGDSKKNILQEYYKDAQLFHEMFPNVQSTNPLFTSEQDIIDNYPKIKENSKELFQEIFPEYSLYECPVCKEKTNIRAMGDHLNKHFGKQ